MLSLRPNHLAFLFLLNCVFLALSPVNAVPIVISRQTDGQSTTVMTQSTTTTPAGPMTQMCVITLTPITVNGQQEVQEVKTCTLTMGDVTNNSGTGGTGTSSTGGDSANSTTTSTDSGNSTDTSTTTDSSGAASTQASGGSAVSVDGISDVPPASATATATDSTGASAASGAASVSASATVAPSGGGAAAAVSAGSVTLIPMSAVSMQTGNAAPTTTVAAAADQAPSSSASSSAFAVPGQKIQVLPIGLGVFAGISVIALIVVGLVTYERTKYRKAFRARKLAESGAGMGYGGMAQR